MTDKKTFAFLHGDQNIGDFMINVACDSLFQNTGLEFFSIYRSKEPQNFLADAPLMTKEMTGMRSAFSTLIYRIARRTTWRLLKLVPNHLFLSLKAKRFIKKTDTLYFNGGDFFFPSTNFPLLIREMEQISLISYAKKQGKRIVILPITAGPFKDHDLLIQEKTELIKSCTTVFARDKISKDFLSSIRSDVIPSLDLALLAGDSIFGDITNIPPNENKATCLISLRNTNIRSTVNTSPSELLSQTISTTHQLGFSAGTYSQHTCDDEVSNLTLPIKEKITSKQITSFSDIYKGLGNRKMVITDRLHVGIASINAGTPVIFIDSPGAGHKLKGTLMSLGLTEYIVAPPNQNSSNYTEDLKRAILLLNSEEERSRYLNQVKEHVKNSKETLYEIIKNDRHK